MPEMPIPSLKRIMRGRPLPLALTVTNGRSQGPESEELKTVGEMRNLGNARAGLAEDIVGPVGVGLDAANPQELHRSPSVSKLFKARGVTA